MDERRGKAWPEDGRVAQPIEGVGGDRGLEMGEGSDMPQLGTVPEHGNCPRHAPNVVAQTAESQQH
jgi:hypothetical protein